MGFQWGFTYGFTLSESNVAREMNRMFMRFHRTGGAVGLIQGCKTRGITCVNWDMTLTTTYLWNCIPSKQEKTVLSWDVDGLFHEHKSINAMFEKFQVVFSHGNQTIKVTIHVFLNVKIIKKN